MSTRSGIGIEREDGFVVGVYCHYDGYPEGVGRILDEHYRDRRKVEELVSLGGISSLGPEIGEAHPFDERREDWTTFYGRDRGEKDTGPKTYADRDLFREIRGSGVEFLYVLTWGNGWIVAKPFGRWRSLPEVMVGGVELLVEPDPDRGADVVVELDADFLKSALVSGATALGRAWVEDRLLHQDRYPGGLFGIDRDELRTVVEAARRDGLIVEEDRPKDEGNYVRS